MISSKLFLNISLLYMQTKQEFNANFCEKMRIAFLIFEESLLHSAN